MTTPDKADVAVLIDRLRAWSLYSFHEMHQDAARALFAEAAETIARLAATPPPASAGEVEAVARAICARNTTYNGPKDTRTLQERIDEEWENWRDDALAAIAAMSPRVENEAVEAETYRQMHDIAVNDLGYASILEALEAALAALSTPSPEKDETIAALREVAQAARAYFDRYMQDEAYDDAVEFTGCSQEQHEAAFTLKAALAQLFGNSEQFKGR